jgi:hypothetical protein
MNPQDLTVINVYDEGHKCKAIIYLSKRPWEQSASMEDKFMGNFSGVCCRSFFYLEKGVSLGYRSVATGG